MIINDDCSPHKTIVNKKGKRFLVPAFCFFFLHAVSFVTSSLLSFVSMNSARLLETVLVGALIGQFVRSFILSLVDALLCS